MRRTEVLQGPRRMKFEEVYGRWRERRLSQAEAAEILPERRRVRMATFCLVGDRKVLDGEAVLMVPSRQNGAG